MKDTHTKRRRGRGWRLLLLVVGLIALYLSVLVVRIVSASRHDDLASGDGLVRADVIVVLGAAQANGQPLPVFRGRLEHAVALYHQGHARYMLFTGGKQPRDQYTEAEAGRMYALQNGVPDSAILLEDRGRTTLQSMRACARIMREHKLQRAILVSDPFHAFRLRRMALDLGLHAFVSPTPYSRVRSFSTRTKYTLRETVVYTVYRLFKM